MRWVVVAVCAAGCGRVGFGSLANHDGDGGADGDAIVTTTNTDGGDACIQAALPITNPGVRSWTPTMAWDGTKLGVAWVEDPANAGTLKFRTVSPGPVLGTVATLPTVGSDGENIAIAPDGTTFRLALSATNGAAHRQVLRSTDGAAPITVASGGKDNIAAHVVVIAPGVTAYAWTQSGTGMNWTLSMAIVDAGGTKIAGDVVVASDLANPYHYELVWNGSELAAFYYSGNTTAGTVKLVRVTTNLTVVAGTPKSIASTTQTNGIGAAWTGDRYLVSWIAGSVNIEYHAADGALLYPRATAGPGSSFAFYANPAAGPSSDLVYWSDIGTSASHLIPVARDGTIAPTQDLPGVTAVAATWVGSAFAVATAQGTLGTEQIFVGNLCP